MDQVLIVAALGNQLDQLERLFEYALIIAIIVFWSGLQGHQKISVFGLEFARRHASFTVGLVYLVLNFAITMHLFRMAALLKLVAPEKTVEALTTLATHHWFLNPFAFFGSDMIGSMTSLWGYGLLIFTWWFCQSSLFLIWPMEDKRKTTDYLLRNLIIVIFLLFGVGALFAINLITETAMEIAVLHAKPLAIEIKKSLGLRLYAPFVGLGLGVALFIFSLWKSERPTQAEPSFEDTISPVHNSFL